MNFVLEYVMGEWVNIHIPEPVMWSYLEKEFTDVIKLRISGANTLDYPGGSYTSD